MGRFIWFGQQFSEELRKEITLRLQVACEVVAGNARKLIRIPWRQKFKGRRSLDPKTGKYVKGRDSIVHIASKPGEPPRTRRYQQGLLGSVFHEVNPVLLRGIVGTPMKHGLYLELGTRRMKARPWLKPALNMSLERIRRIAEKKMPNG